MSRKLSLKERTIVVLLPLVAVWIQRLLGCTIKKSYFGRDEAIALAREGVLYSFWHNNSFFAASIFPNQNVYLLISSSKDGELIRRIVEAFGNRSVSGSSSRGGVGALKKIVKLLREKNAVGFTPDGPRGPLYQVQNGVLMAALNSGKPIIPVHYQATREWVFEKSWDKHRIPKPFSHIVLSFGEPIYLPQVENPTDEYYQANRELLREKMMQNMKFCQDQCQKILNGS